MKKSVLAILFSLFHLLVLAQIKPSRPIQTDDANPTAPSTFSNVEASARISHSKFSAAKKGYHSL
jgi:hypothetical protein